MLTFRYRFALEEGLILLVQLYSKFYFRLSEAHHPDGDLHVRMSLTLVPERGVCVTAIPRFQHGDK
jgi:hypothetical protein